MMLKGEMSMLNVLLLEKPEELNIVAIATLLQNKCDEAPQFFMQSPLIIDCANVADRLEEDASALDFSLLKTTLLDIGFIPVGIRNAPASMNTSLAKSGWAVMRETAKATAVVNTSPSTSETNNEENEALATDKVAPESAEKSVKTSMIIERPVRSGQQIYAADADMTVIAPTSAGSEVVADGSIHVYGALRGRVLAGARGDKSARIYCQSLQAELIAIAGCFQLLDESDTKLKGKPAKIRLEGEKLVIEAL